MKQRRSVGGSRDNALFLIAALALSGFTPFSQVRNVCPRCPGPAADRVVLESGAQLDCQVVAQNVDSYIVERFGELRVVEKAQVASLKLREEIKVDATADQVVLKSGVVFSGRLVDEAKDRYFVLEMNGRRHVAWTSTVRRVYKGGQRHYPLP
jgi:hypothetical protein